MIAGDNTSYDDACMFKECKEFKRTLKPELPQGHK